MTFFESPRRRLALIAVGLFVLTLCALGQTFSAAIVARAVLLLSALGALIWWARRGLNSGHARAALPPRLELVQRVGLSPRTSVALVEVDGEPYLIVHGDGFARLRPTHKPRPHTATVFELPEVRSLA